ncbi:DNA cytosine methyltransferase [Streptomyces sp. WAC06614]|uniref:DNA cytosine methyltransferase n=1 Tax=Streptomyces sp. WAC06614 TaxID=2487416 RepID=UPI000F76D27A|nr:DNA cytosine methyltransferase [Streptomyces sp. WAC06614]RSS84154.1 DNA cytosine methyltransferase [Streptomyces sp. WAC06614]
MTSSDAASRILENPYILDLFAGPGGLDVAAHMLDVPSLGIEWDKDACETRYMAGLATWHADVSAVRQRRFEDLPKELNVLAGGPPCQTYSVAGNGAGRKALEEVKRLVHELVVGRVDEEGIDAELKELESKGGDPRTALVLEPLRYAIKALHSDNRSGRPFDVIVLEQVPQVKELWEVYRSALKEGLPRPDGSRVPYEVAAVKTLHTEAYGVPQTRRRTILIARLQEHGVPPLPVATHHAYNLRNPVQGGPDDPAATLPAEKGTDPTPRPWVAMGEVLARATAGRPGGLRAPFEIRSNYGSGGDPSKRGIRTDRQPSFTVTGKVSRNAVRYPQSSTQPDPDRLTITEAGILQTFPPNYPWEGGDRSQQVGNAVPPLFGMHVLAAALSLPLPPEEGLREDWRIATEEDRATLRKEGCGAPDGCGPDCPEPKDQSSPSGSSGSSRPRTRASAKRSEK